VVSLFLPSFSVSDQLFFVIMDFHAEFVRDMPLSRYLKRAVDPPSNFYREQELSPEEHKRVLEAIKYRTPNSEIRPTGWDAPFGERGPPYIPMDELTIENLGIQRCSVRLNYCGEGQPGRVDLIPEERKWKCLLCPVKFLRAQHLHDHVTRFHAKFHVGFLNGLFHHFKTCTVCSEYTSQIPSSIFPLYLCVIL
jgi:hypothetical protein